MFIEIWRVLFVYSYSLNWNPSTPHNYCVIDLPYCISLHHTFAPKMEFSFPTDLWHSMCCGRSLNMNMCHWAILKGNFVCRLLTPNTDKGHSQKHNNYDDQVIIIKDFHSCAILVWAIKVRAWKPDHNNKNNW